MAAMLPCTSCVCYQMRSPVKYLNAVHVLLVTTLFQGRGEYLLHVQPCTGEQHGANCSILHFNTQKKKKRWHLMHDSPGLQAATYMR